jgi:hypothetical protein
MQESKKSSITAFIMIFLLLVVIAFELFIMKYHWDDNNGLNKIDTITVVDHPIDLTIKDSTTTNSKHSVGGIHVDTTKLRSSQSRGIHYKKHKAGGFGAIITDAAEYKIIDSIETYKPHNKSVISLYKLNNNSTNYNALYWKNLDDLYDASDSAQYYIDNAPRDIKGNAHLTQQYYYWESRFQHFKSMNYGEVNNR